MEISAQSIAFDVNAAIDLHIDMVYRIALQNVQNREDAEDITQEVMLKLYGCGKRFADDEHIKAWLIKVTVNKCRDFFRTNWFRKRVALEYISDSSNNAESELLDELKDLAPIYKNVLYLYYYEGYSIEDIAKILGKSKNTIGSRLSRARALLKDKLEDNT